MLPYALSSAVRRVLPGYCIGDFPGAVRFMLSSMTPTRTGLLGTATEVTSPRTQLIRPESVAAILALRFFIDPLRTRRWQAVA